MKNLQDRKLKIGILKIWHFLIAALIVYTRKFKIESLKIWHFLIAALIVYTIPIAAYTLNFYKSPFSKKPDDWASLGDYLGGVAGSLISGASHFRKNMLRGCMKVLSLSNKQWDDGCLSRPAIEPFAQAAL
jgi:hypothetical protein